MLWDATLHDITIDTADITDALALSPSTTRQGTAITLANITSTGSGLGRLLQLPRLRTRPA